MKLIKYILFIIILIISAVFIKELDSLNVLADGTPIKVKIPYLTNAVGFGEGLDVWQAIIFTLSIGVFIQIISQKAEIISLKSTLRKANDELDSLRNQDLDDDIELVDDDNLDDEI